MLRRCSNRIAVSVLVAVAALGGLAHGQTIPGVEIDRAQFIVSTKGPDGKWASRETDRVPLRPEGACYRWRLHFSKNAVGELAWAEEFELPAKPEIWQHPDRFELNKDRTVAVTKKQETPKDGWISHGWCVAKGDPPGKYVIKVYVQDRMARSFEFVVE